MSAARRTLAGVALGTSLLALAGCSRGRAEFPELAADSGAAAPLDSFAISVRTAQDAWDAGEGDRAASITARALFEALRRRPQAPWADRARGLADSLGFGAEVAGSDAIALTNLFSRSDPEGPTWPHLMWRDEDGPRMQTVEGAGLHLKELATSRFDGGVARESSQTAALWSRRASAGGQPIVMVWAQSDGGRWDLLQTLGPDSLGGIGTGHFARGDTAVELTTRTFRPTPHFDECATCPHVWRDRRFAWTPRGFVRADDRVVPSAYATFTGFVQSLIAGDDEKAALYVVDPMLVEFARRYEWHEAARGRWRVAPATDEKSAEMLFYRGVADAFRVAFEAREGAWRIAGFEQTGRAVQ